MKIYLDNAATTPLSREVFDVMAPYFMENFGNPSSSHSQGREAKNAIEKSRKTIADLLHTEPGCILFTSGGTEADNTAIITAIRGGGIRFAITTPFEHHAVLNTLKFLEQNGEIKLAYLMHDENGNLSTRHLESLLAFNSRAFVSVMHGNNEVGNLNNIAEIAAICKQHNAVFHSDTVQTMGHYEYHLNEIDVDFIVGSAHKFNGPKGVGFLYHSAGTNVRSLIKGGGQEKGYRAGTENVAGIVGLAEALKISLRDRQEDEQRIRSLKERMIARLRESIPGVSFNANSANPEKSIYTVLSVSLPPLDALSPILNYLDSYGICASGGSACSSHSSGGSHVLHALSYDFARPVIRFSFGKFNTAQDVDVAVARLSEIYEYAVKGLKIAG